MNANFAPMNDQLCAECAKPIPVEDWEDDAKVHFRASDALPVHAGCCLDDRCKA